MPIQTNDAIRKYSSNTLILENNGASITSTSVMAADDLTYDLSTTDHADAPNATFALRCQFSSAPANNTPVVLILQALDIDGTNDEPDPDSGYQPRRSAVFLIKGVASSNLYVSADAYEIPRKGKAWLLNQTNQTISSGWGLKMTAFTYGPKV